MPRGVGGVWIRRGKDDGGRRKMLDHGERMVCRTGVEEKPKEAR
jgi:hypothetical protein